MTMIINAIKEMLAPPKKRTEVRCVWNHETEF